MPLIEDLQQAIEAVKLVKALAEKVRSHLTHDGNMDDVAKIELTLLEMGLIVAALENSVGGL